MRLNQLIQLYFYLCQVYEEELQWHCKRYTKNGKTPLFTDQEVLTVYLFGLCYCRMKDLKGCYEHMRCYYLDWFPDLPSYQAFVNRLNRMSSVFCPLAQRVYADQCQQNGDEPCLGILLTDSMPIVTCAGVRRGKVARQLVDYGYSPTKKMKY